MTAFLLMPSAAAISAQEQPKARICRKAMSISRDHTIARLISTSFHNTKLCLIGYEQVAAKSLALLPNCSYIVPTIIQDEAAMGQIADSSIRARIATSTKREATEVLKAMGLSVSDVMRVVMCRIAVEKRLPFEVRIPNAETLEAIAELETGKSKKFNSVAELMADLHADD